MTHLEVTLHHAIHVSRTVLVELDMMAGTFFYSTAPRSTAYRRGVGIYRMARKDKDSTSIYERRCLAENRGNSYQK